MQTSEIRFLYKFVCKVHNVLAVSTGLSLFNMNDKITVQEKKLREYLGRTLQARQTNSIDMQSLVKDGRMQVNQAYCLNPVAKKSNGTKN